MNHQWKSYAAGLCFFGCASTTSLNGSAADLSDVYLVTSHSESAAGNSHLREVLSLERDGSVLQLNVATGDGSILSIPVALTARGEIASNSQDRSVTCFTMARNVLAHQRLPAGAATASVFVQFAASIVQIPLRVRSIEAQGSMRRFGLDGVSAGWLGLGHSAVHAGMFVSVYIAADGDDLTAATFDEVQFLGDPAQIVGRSGCTLQRAIPRKQAVTAT